MMMHEDVVCGRAIDASTMVWASRYHGEPYFFCSLMCREQFELDPEAFLPPSEGGTVPPAVMLRVVS